MAGASDHSSAPATAEPESLTFIPGPPPEFTLMLGGKRPGLYINDKHVDDYLPQELNEMIIRTILTSADHYE